MTEENAREGRRRKTAGDTWRNACVRWLNNHGWPGAGYELRNRHSDITGTWDLAVEVTIETWDKIFRKLEQAERDAHARGLSDFCVWKKRRGATDPGYGAVIMDANRFFPMVQRLEKLEAQAVEADDAFTRGWIAHERYMAEKSTREVV